MSEFGTLLLSFLGGAGGAAAAIYLSKRLLEQQLSKDLERFRGALALSHTRYSQDYELFATRRSEVYASVYAAFERARGAYGGHFNSLVERHVYDDASEKGLRKLMSMLTRISDEDRDRVIELLEEGSRDQAGKLATRLVERDQLRGAQELWNTFRNQFIIDGLYFAPDVEALLVEAMDHFAHLSIFADNRIDGETPREYREPAALMTKLADLSGKLRAAMRAEMQIGFAVAEAKK